MPSLYILVIYPSWYRDSAELSLAFDLFKNNFPPDYPLKFILLETANNTDDYVDDIELNQALKAALKDIGHLQPLAADVVFLVKQPALLMHKEIIHRMVNLLNQDNIDCVVPSAYPDQYPEEKAAHYFTLAGYERYVCVYLKNKQLEFTAYDNRPVSMFAIKYSSLTSIISAAQPDYNLFIIPQLPDCNTVVSTGAYIHPFADYFSGANQQMIELIPSTATSLLDIGCSNGEFGHAVKKQRNILVEGIEVNTTAANLAQLKLDKVYKTNALTLKTDKMFDCVSLLDVLEHFAEPDALLKHIARYFLHDNGRLLLSIPNVGHWSIVLDLLSGRWDYLPGGTLCTTHVRFFTRKTISELLGHTGYEVKKILPVQAELPPKVQHNFVLLEKQGQHIDWESLKTVSFRIVAKKSISND